MAITQGYGYGAGKRRGEGVALNEVEVPPEVVAPFVVSQPALALDGDDLIVTAPVFDGSEPLAVSIALTRDGADVSGEVLDGRIVGARREQDVTYWIEGSASNAGGIVAADTVSLLVEADEVPVGPPQAFTDIPNGNRRTMATVTPEGRVSIANETSAIVGELGVTHYFARVENMLGKTLSVSRSTGAPNQNGDLLNLWQMTWAYDPDGEWFPFDSVVIAGSGPASEVVASNNAPLTQNTVYIGRKGVFTDTRWAKAIARWRANPATSPTASGDANFVVGMLPPNDHAPALPLHGFRFGTGPRVIVMTGNVHTDEHIAAYAYEAAVDRMLGDDPAAVALRAQATVYCYPAMNPQARYAGASRNEVETGQNANRIWGAGFDAINLSRMMRAVWAADLPAKIEGILDYHDNTFFPSAYRGALYSYDASDIVGYLRAQYLTRVGRDVVPEAPGTDPTTIQSYINATYDADWGVTVEHGSALTDGYSDWRAWGNDIGGAVIDYVTNAGTWIKPAWETVGSTLTQTGGSVTATEAGNPDICFRIPEGKTIEIIIDARLVNITGLYLRQSPNTALAGAESIELHSQLDRPAQYKRTQTVTWTAERPYVGLIGSRTNAAQPASIQLFSIVKYRVIGQ